MHTHKFLFAAVAGFPRSYDAIEESFGDLGWICVCSFGRESLTERALVEAEVVSELRLHEDYVRIGRDLRDVHVLPDPTLVMIFTNY